ncbi:MAG: hypothetical protein ACPG21_01100 [Crocinitomicaceae bacterium]
MILARILLFSAFLTSFLSQAMERELELWNTYKIVKEVKNDSLDSDQCLIIGQAVDADSRLPIVAGVFADVRNQTKVSSDSEGKFQFQANENGSAMFFYHPEYGEIIIPNSVIKPQYIIEIKISMRYHSEEVEVEKPVIYLYAKEKTNVSIKLKPVGELTFTYPNYTDEWKVTTADNSMLEVAGKNYPYLFWEGRHKRLNFKGDASGMEGFYIKTDTTIEFLEAQLSMLGFNATESADFITYWGPRLQAFPFSAIQFWVDNEYEEQIAVIEVNPKPDHTKRVFMIFKGVNEDMKVDYFTPQKFKPVNRDGLVHIEWGGAEL